MHIGVPKEIKNHEYRVGLTPAGVRELVSAGHQVTVEKDLGKAIGFTNELYKTAGAVIGATAQEVFYSADMIVKVKEPQEQECRMLRENQILFTFLHLAADLQQTKLLKESGAYCVAYETVNDSNGRLPLLAPMSEVAGRLSIQAVARCLEKAHGGPGILLGGVPGVAPAKVVVLGGGVVGLNAARMAMGLGAQVTILDKSIPRLNQINELYGTQINTVFSTQDAIEEYLKIADAVIGAVLIPGAAAPKLVRNSHLQLMKPGTVLVDVAIDQGGCFESSVATTHNDPTYLKDDIIHYCVANMPGTVAKTSSAALTNATLPYALKLANKGISALNESQGFLNGLNIAKGKVTFKAVAEALGDTYYVAEEVIK